MINRDEIKRAVVCVGGQTALADRLTEIMQKQIKQAHIWNWLNRDKKLEGEYCIPIEKATEGKVTRHQLRPDLYPMEADS